MTREFEGDLAGAVFWGVDLRGARLRDVDLTGVRISHAWVVDVEIDALVERLVINGVDVTGYVNERDAWYPLRAMLRPADAGGMRAAWAALEAEWARLLDEAGTRSDDAWHRSVGGEWSLVETLRHLVFAVDKWWTAPVLGLGFHPFGWPNTGSIDFPWPSVDRRLAPPTAEVVAVWHERVALVRDGMAGLRDGDLARTVDVLENGSHTVEACAHTVFEEAFWHLRYARRDLAAP